MERLTEWLGRCLAWFGRTKLDREFGEELSSHLDMAMSDEIARGTPEAEARRRAMVKLGGVTQTVQGHRLSRGLPIVDAIATDLGQGVRLLIRSRGFSSVVVLSLTIGIGANTAVFSVINALLFRPLPVPDPSRLVRLVAGPASDTWTYPLWEQIRMRPELFEGTAAWGTPRRFNLIDGSALQPVSVYTVSGEFSRVIGVVPFRGRLINEADDVAGGPPDGFAAVISHAFWQRHFGGTEDAVGKVLWLDRAPVTVVGITPPGFFGPEVGSPFDVMLPITTLPNALLGNRGFFWVSILARLKLGQSTEAAMRALRAVQPAIRSATEPTGLRPEQLQEYLKEPIGVVPASTGVSSLRSKYGAPLFAIMAAVFLLLIIGCVNLAMLMTARNDARRHEFSVRLALGASRAQLVQRLLTPVLT